MRSDVALERVYWGEINGFYNYKWHSHGASYLVFDLALYHLYSDVRYGQKISFRQYLRISCVAPEKWKIVDVCDCYLHYKTGKYTYNYTNIYMKTYFDALRLKRLYKKQQKREADAEYSSKRAELIKLWQKDINNFHDDYLEQIGVYLKKGKKIQ